MNAARMTASFAIVVGFVSAGCNDREATPAPAESPSSTAPSTLTVSELQPPEQENASKYSDVVFDPCTYVSDETIVRAGFDPASRERRDFVAEYTFFGCAFKSPTRELFLNSGNVAFDDQRRRYDDRGTASSLPPVNGRDAFLVVDPKDERTCITILRTTVGAVFVTSSLQDFHDAQAPCDGMSELVQIIEPTIGAEN
ncbi:DUF3558 family protein [Antrihabitans sp. YC2-6]|uniref:DUF3558 family protein n=1 Tax=Antrihabitans sp. YC2-6 TaxID=2799498 RepID=UPI0018F28743|nr:DUF3558 family protein [Antrihabitans sp. YC2-6]MBJ8346362.1 DUF3558 domain-containing protein [Antrihabitans sp. YC2-6]